MPDGLETIGSYAFRDIQLRTIIVPNSVTSIGAGAFQGCPLESITLPFVGGSRKISSSVKSSDYSWNGGSEYIFGYIFGGATSYGTSSSAPSIPSGTIYQGQSSSRSGSNYYWTGYYIPSTLKTVTITDATGISANAFYGCTMIESLTLNEGITTIYDKAFYNCSALKSMVLPSSVTEVGNYAFYGCRDMASITLSNFAKINDYTYYKCSLLDGVVLPETLTAIGNNAFYGCVGLTRIAIPKGVVSIGDNAINSERDFRKTQQKIPNKIENSLQMIA